MIRVPKKACTKMHCNLCKKHEGMLTMHITRDWRKYEKDRSEKTDFHATKKGEKKPNSAQQSFVQLSKKLDKLKKVIKKQTTKSKKRHQYNRDSNLE